jgi:hypothetical protein
LKPDPELSALALETVTRRSKVAQTLTEVAAVSENPLDTSGEAELLDFGLRFFQHVQGGEGAFWSALKEQGAAMATSVAKARTRFQGLTERLKEEAQHASALEAQEMGVRIKLSQRFHREFPATSALLQVTNSVPPVAGPPATEAIRLSRDLLGRKVDSWTFDVGEFRSCDILETRFAGDLGQYEVKARVRGSFSGTERDFRLRLSYREQEGSWRLVLVEQAE